MNQPTRYLIINADDFGRSEGINRGVIRGHEDGVVTSASLMVRWPAAAPAAAYAREHPDLSVGLHVDLGEYVYRDDQWQALYGVVDLRDAAAVEREIRNQLETFRVLVGRDPTHIDSHQHVHRTDPVRSALIDAAAVLNVPLRHVTPAVQYCGKFYGQCHTGVDLRTAIGVEGLIRSLGELPAGLSELICHPALALDFESDYRWQREEEVRTLCDPRIRQALRAMQIELRSFHNHAIAPSALRLSAAPAQTA